jgi:transcriptional regulator with XRE-family HTH domain
MRELIEILKTRRKDLGLSQAEVSQRAGYYFDAVRKWESWQTTPGLFALENWAEVLGLELKLEERGQ